MYKIINSEMVKRLGDGACIPNDPKNLDWQQYQEWLASGNKPYPQDFIDPRPARIIELKGLLAATDYKVLPDYDGATPEDYAQRDLWRKEVRMLENELEQDKNQAAGKN